MHKCHSGNLPDNFNHLFTTVNQVHCHATRSATRGAYFWQMAHTKYGKRSLKHLGPKIWHKIDPSLHDSSHLKNSTETYLSLPMKTDSMVLKLGVLYVNCIPFHRTYSPLHFQIVHFPLNIFPPPIAIFYSILLTLLYILPLLTQLGCVNNGSMYNRVKSME